MKILYKLILISCTFSLLTNCSDLLEEIPKDRITPASYFQDEEQAQIALNGVYQNLHNVAVRGFEYKLMGLSDLVKIVSGNERQGLKTYTHTAGNNMVLNVWTQHYSLINRANMVIENTEANSASITGAERIIGEAKFWRAFMYFDLVRLFGDVPLTLESPKSLDALQLPRTSEISVLNQVLEDLRYAEKNCLSATNTAFGQVSAEAAKAIKAKTFLWIASMAKKNSTGYETQDALVNYDSAQVNASAIVESGNFELVSYYPDVFRVEDKTNKETMLSIRYNISFTGGRTGSHMGLLGPQVLGGAINTLMGTDYAYSLYEGATDTRRDWNLANAKIQNNTNNYGSLKYNNNWDYCIGKLRRWPLKQDELSIYFRDKWHTDEPLIRYSDVLLILAEAENELGNSGEAMIAANKVRERARNYNDTGFEIYEYESVHGARNIASNIDGVPDWVGLSQDALRDSIIVERAREFVGESIDRWYDLKRTGKLVEQLEFVRTYLNPVTGKTERKWKYGTNYAEKHNYLPIPLPEMDANSQLTQNPGY